MVGQGKVEWNESMSVGNAHLDDQHKKILGKIEELREELLIRINLGHVKKTVDFFEKYFMEHLSSEEKYMADHGYPELESHKKLHAGFIDYAKGFQNDFNYKYVLVSASDEQLKRFLLEAEKFFKNWWINHILVEDHKYATYIAAHKNGKA